MSERETMPTEPCGCYTRMLPDGSIDQLVCEMHSAQQIAVVTTYMLGRDAGALEQRAIQERHNFDRGFSAGITHTVRGMLPALERVDRWMMKALAAYEGDPEPSENEGKNAHADLCRLIMLIRELRP